MRFGADGRLDDQCVKGVGDQGDDHIGRLDGLVKSSGIVDIEGNGLGVLEALAELLGTFEGSAGWFWGRLVSSFPTTQRSHSLGVVKAAYQR